MRRIIIMPAVERLLFAVGAIAIVMMAMTYVSQQGLRVNGRDWASAPPPAPTASESDSHANRFLGIFAR